MFNSQLSLSQRNNPTRHCLLNSCSRDSLDLNLTKVFDLRSSLEGGEPFSGNMIWADYDTLLWAPYSAWFCGVRVSNGEETVYSPHMALQFEWDEHKAVLNLKRHRVSFQEATTVFADPLVSYTERAGRIRIISARFPTLKEKKQYEEAK